MLNTASAAISAAASPPRQRDSFLSMVDVSAKTSLSRTTICKYVREGIFPKPIPMLGRRVAWLESEVWEWMNARIEERNRKANRNA
jgi:prophage regulatory protein